MNTFSEVYDKLAGGTVGNWLAIVGVLSLIYWAWRIAVAWQHRQSNVLTSDAPGDSAPRPADVAVIPASPAEDIAVIAAAVYAMMGAARIVHIEPVHQDQTWAAEGRWMQQTSHRLH